MGYLQCILGVLLLQCQIVFTQEAGKICKWFLKLCMLWRIRLTRNKNMSGKLAGTTMSKISYEGVVALKMDGLVSTLRTLRPEDEQNRLFETSRLNRLFSEPPLLHKRFY